MSRKSRDSSGLFIEQMGHDVSTLSTAELGGFLIRLSEQVSNIAKDVEQVHHVLLEGNGTPALTVQVATMNTRLHVLEEANKDYRIPRHVWMGIVVSAIIGLAGIIVAIKNLM